MASTEGKKDRKVSRVESFRTSLKIQKQKLLAQKQLQNQIEKLGIGTKLKEKKDDKKEENEKSKFPFGPVKKLSRSREISESEYFEKEKRKISEPTSLPSVTPPPESPPALPEPEEPPAPVVPVEVARQRTPVHPDSPLLAKAEPNPIRKRFAQFNRSLRKARSFRANREKAADCSPILPPSPPIQPDIEVSFLVRKTVMGRSGWKIIPEDESLNLKMNQAILGQVLERIKDMQYCGQPIPDKISIRIT